MINVREELSRHLEETYFRSISILKQRGIDVSSSEEMRDELLPFLNAIPNHIKIEDDQYKIIEKWIDMEIVNENYLAHPLQIAILTYINSCYTSRKE
jgi:hypothetical protein